MFRLPSRWTEATATEKGLHSHRLPLCLKGHLHCPVFVNKVGGRTLSGLTLFPVLNPESSVFNNTASLLKNDADDVCLNAAHS